MKILFLSHYFPPEVNAPAARTFDHCIRWAQAGHDVTVVTCAPNCPDGVVYAGYKNRLRRQIENVEGVRVVRAWTYLAPNAGTVRRIANYLSYMLSATLASILLPRPDVVIATSPQFFCGWAGALVSRLKRRPFVLEIRDIWPEGIVAVGAIRNRWILRLLERLERWLYRSAAHIVTVGHGYREKILKRVNLGDRLTVIPNGVDLQLFVPREPDAQFLNRWSLTDKFVCSYAGTIGMTSGLEVVPEAARLLKQRGRRDISFCLVGDGAVRGQLEALARQAGVDDMVIFTGRQPKARMPAILASSDACLVHLRKHEHFEALIPSKIFETMAMARPIIMGVQGQSRKIVMEAGAGLEMEPESAESLVQAVERLADDPHFTSRIGRSARDYVAEHYNRDVLAERFLRLLEAVAGEDVTEVPTQESAVVELHGQQRCLSEQNGELPSPAENR